MQSDGFEQWFKLNKSLTNPLSELSKTATEILRRTAQQNLELMSENCFRLSEQLKRLSHVKKPEELLNFQKDYVNENISATIENTQKIMQLCMENFEEFSKLCSSALRDPITQAVRTAEKATEKERHHHTTK